MSMSTVRVNVQGGYDIHIGNGILNDCGKLLPEAWHGKRCAVITDDTVEKLYLPRVMASLQAASIDAHAYAYPAGECSKNLETLSAILEFMAQIPLTRSDFVIALGGGVAGDMAGFAAGCYMRRIPFVQLPTTYLAAVDSSVGGKTAVNLTSGKNLAGLFHQPEMVLCDIDCLKTLSPADYACGAAEAIKTGVLFDRALFEIFDSGAAASKEEEIIRRCVTEKAKVVEQDECETGLRKLLNLGHTYAHAIERLSGYETPHGHAVGIGLAMAARAAAKMNDMQKEDARRIVETLSKNNLPVHCPYNANDMHEAAMTDKKRAGASLSIIVPREIGACEIRKIKAEAFIDYIRAGMEDA